MLTIIAYKCVYVYRFIYWLLELRGEYGKQEMSGQAFLAGYGQQLKAQ